MQLRYSAASFCTARQHLAACALFYQRLQVKIIKLVDVSYGGENGFNQAIELSAEVLSNVKFIQEKKLIGKCWLFRTEPTVM